MEKQEYVWTKNRQLSLKMKLDIDDLNKGKILFSNYVRDLLTPVQNKTLDMGNGYHLELQLSMPKFEDYKVRRVQAGQYEFSIDFVIVEKSFKLVADTTF